MLLASHAGEIRISPFIFRLPRHLRFRRIFERYDNHKCFLQLGAATHSRTRLDFNAVGLYGRASNITQVFDKLVIQVLNPVILPAISAQKRAGGDLKRIYLNAIELIAVVQWPLLLFFALMADPIIWIWLGETWSKSCLLFGCCA